MMKISKETLALLRNFASINGNLLIKPGNVISTLSASKSVYASVTVKEDFGTEFGIYDLNELLGIAALFDDPDYEFTEKTLTVKQGKNNVKYHGASSEVLTFPAKPIKVPPADIEFDITADQINMIMKTAGVLRAVDVTIEGDGKSLRVVVGDKKNSSANNYVMEIGDTDSTFKAHIRVDNIKIIPGDYKFELAAKKIARLTAGPLEYVLVLEQDSVFED